MKTENQRLAGVLPTISTVPAMMFEAARVRRVDGQEVPDCPQPFNSLVDAEKYVADTPVSNDGTRPWIRNATPSPISGSFLMVGAKWLHSEPQGAFKRVPDEVRRTMCYPKTSHHESDVVGSERRQRFKAAYKLIRQSNDPRRRRRQFRKYQRALTHQNGGQ